MMKTRTLIVIGFFVVASFAAAEEFIDDFRVAKLEGRLAERGAWHFENGIASCVADLDLYKKYKNHGPILKWPCEFGNATIQCEVKATDCQRVVFTLNGEGHVFRVTLADERPNAPAGASKVPTRLIAWETKSSKQNKGDTIKPEGMPDLSAINGKWVQLKITIKEDRAVLVIGDFRTEVTHAALSRDKNTVMLTFAHGELSVRNYRMTTSGSGVGKR